MKQNILVTIIFSFIVNAILISIPGDQDLAVTLGQATGYSVWVVLNSYVVGKYLANDWIRKHQLFSMLCTAALSIAFNAILITTILIICSIVYYFRNRTQKKPDSNLLSNQRED